MRTFREKLLERRRVAWETVPIGSTMNEHFAAGFESGAREALLLLAEDLMDRRHDKMRLSEGEDFPHGMGHAYHLSAELLRARAEELR